MAKKASLKRILNCLPSRDTQNDWSIDSAREAGVLAIAAIPASKDLREPWWQIGDQGPLVPVLVGPRQILCCDGTL